MAYFAFANLDETDLLEIKRLETELGRPLVAMKSVDLHPADLDDTGIAAVKSLEARLGVALVAVDP